MSTRAQVTMNVLPPWLRAAQTSTVFFLGPGSIPPLSFVTRQMALKTWPPLGAGEWTRMNQPKDKCIMYIYYCNILTWMECAPLGWCNENSLEYILSPAGRGNIYFSPSAAHQPPGALWCVWPNYNPKTCMCKVRDVHASSEGCKLVERRNRTVIGRREFEWMLTGLGGWGFGMTQGRQNNNWTIYRIVATYSKVLENLLLHHFCVLFNYEDYVTMTKWSCSKYNAV